uniref:U3 small nucleolar ribonucleoprotein protein MPP10 n=1 Tax=Pyramimonas obovata TaxID=1411642 RepID=A0A7S0WTX1_9CHLO|mmetsp:Transcript_38717/g.84229  ORF Transcript_38717/g.84229 Transcript_38717/m.84229 type:complete len:727 (+) Transcript_38717:84-2264(+)
MVAGPVPPPPIDFTAAHTEVLSSFEAAAESKGAFLVASQELAAGARAAAKVLYAQAAAQLTRTGSSAASGLLPELYTDGFDAEQIWEQISLQHTPLVAKARRILRKAQATLASGGPEALLKDSDAKLRKTGNTVKESHDDSTDIDSDEGGDDLDAAIEQLEQGGELKDNYGEDEDEQVEEEGADEDAKHGNSACTLKKRKKKKGEDEFLDFDEMERFINEAEAAEAEEGLGDSDDESSEDDDDGPVFPDADNTDSENEDVLDATQRPDEERDDEHDLEAALAYTSALAGVDRSTTGRTRISSRRLVEDQASDEENDENDEEDENTIMYEDFFGKRPKKVSNQAAEVEGSDDEVEGSDDDQEADNEGEEHSDTDGTEEEEEGEDESEGDDEAQTSGEEGEEKAMSTHEKRLQRMNARIEELEARALAGAEWHMRGEVMATARPKNSALEVDLDFEHVAAPPPVITEEITKSLEQIIIQRIIEQRFDDVVRYTPSDAPAKRKEVELDDQKSKKGLGELYEEEFLQARAGPSQADEEETELQAEARALFKALCVRLDALSHFQFAPKPHVEELNIKSDVPALTIEEVAPVAMAQADRTAPQESFKGGQLAGKKAAGAVMGESELTSADRKKGRAKRKRAYANKEKASNSKKAKSLAAKGFTASDMATVERAKKAGAAITTDGHSDYAKSTRVFAALQDASVAVAGGLKGKQKGDGQREEVAGRKFTGKL